MRRTAVSSRFHTGKLGEGRALRALALLGVAGLSALLAGCGAGSEFLPSNLPGTGGGSVFIITTTTLEDGVVGRSYMKSIDTSGGVRPVTSCGVVGGTIPPGMTVSATTTGCVLGGTPGAAGTFDFTLRADDASLPAPRNDTQAFTLVIRQEFSITGPAPDPLPDGIEDSGYNLAFTVTTDTTVGLNDVGQAAERGNGPLTNCVLTGLPAGMTSSVSNIGNSSCQVTLGGAPNIGLTSNSLPQLFTLTLAVTDTPISASNTPARTISQANIDLTIRGPLAFSLITADPASTTSCTLPPGGGTFNDAAGGGNAPAAVTGRRYGNPSNATRCDLLFVARGGRPPYTWATLSPAPTPIACSQSGTTFRCNSGGNGVSGATVPNFAVRVNDTGNAATASLMQTSDDQGHGVHAIAVNNELVINNQFLPNGVVGQPYSVTLRCDSGTGACGGTGKQGNAQALYTWSEVGGPANADLSVTGTNVAQPGNGLYSGTPTSANTGPFTVTVTVTDDGNDTTPSCAAATTCPQAMLDYNIFNQLLIVDAAENLSQFYLTSGLTPFATFDHRADLDNNATPFRAAFTPNGTFAVVIDDTNNEAHIIETGTPANVTDLALSSAPTALVIGPATSPLNNPDSWVAYVALGGTGIDVVDLDPTSGNFGTVINTITTTNPADDLAITPTFAGPQTRLYYLDTAGQRVCVINAEPSSGTFQQEIDLVAGGGLDCIDLSSFEIPQHIEATPNGLQALVTTTDNGGDAGPGNAHVVRIDTNPANTGTTRDTVQGNLDLTGGMLGCFLPRELRSMPNSSQVWVLCAVDTTTGDRIVRVDPATPASAGAPIDLSGQSGGNDAEDLAFNSGGSLAVVTVPAVDLIIPINGTTVATAIDTTAPTGNQNDITNPEGIDHIRDPQLNTSIDVTFTSLPTAQRGKPYKGTVPAQGGVQPYSWSAEGLGEAGTACEGLSLEPMTGMISGTPVNAGTCSFSVEVTDSTRGAKQSRTLATTIRVK